MPPAWLEDFTDRVTAHMEPRDPRAPIGCHVCHNDGLWEVTLFLSRTEIFGGEFDGHSIPARFMLDVGGVLTVFEEVESCWWQPFPSDSHDELGAQLSLLGTFAGQAIWLRITAEQPRGLESGRVANVLGGVIEQRW